MTTTSPETIKYQAPPEGLEYVPLSAEHITTTIRNKLNDPSWTLKEFSTEHQLCKGSGVIMTLKQLAGLKYNDVEKFYQDEVSPSKVLNILNDTHTGLLNQKKLILNPVVGIIDEEFLDKDTLLAYAEETGASEDNIYSEDIVRSVYDATISEWIEKGVGNTFNEFTESGRHRIVSLLTLCDAQGVDPNDVPIWVEVRIYRDIEEGVLAVIAANGSRTMTPGEKLSLRVSAKGIDLADYTKAASVIKDTTSKGKKRVVIKELFQTLVYSLISVDELTKNTVGLIGKAFIREVIDRDTYPLVTFEDVDFLKSIVSSFSNLLGLYPKTGNVAREANTIGKQLADQYLPPASVEAPVLETVKEPEQVLPSEVITELTTKWNTESVLDASTQEVLSHIQDPLDGADLSVILPIGVSKVVSSWKLDTSVSIDGAVKRFTTLALKGRGHLDNEGLVRSVLEVINDELLNQINNGETQYTKLASALFNKFASDNKQPE